MSMAHDQLPLVLKMKHIQETLGLSKGTAYELAHTKGFPAIRIGRVIRVPREAFFEWMEKQAAQRVSHD